MHDDATRRWVLEVVAAKLRGKRKLGNRDIREVCEETGLGEEEGRRLLKELTSPFGPIVGTPVMGDRLGLGSIIDIERVDP